jgi:hypothetical protein
MRRHVAEAFATLILAPLAGGALAAPIWRRRAAESRASAPLRPAAPAAAAPAE